MRRMNREQEETKEGVLENHFKKIGSTYGKKALKAVQSDRNQLLNESVETTKELHEEEELSPLEIYESEEWQKAHKRVDQAYEATSMIKEGVDEPLPWEKNHGE